LAAALLLAVSHLPASARVLPLQVSDNGHFLETSDGAPFFWLGDTGWLMFEKLNRADTEKYFDDRHRKGFNVIQVMVIHSAGEKNAYGAPALSHGDGAHPAVTAGNRMHAAGEYDYWDHIEWVLDRAAERGMYLGLVDCWGSVVERRSESRERGNICALSGQTVPEQIECDLDSRRRYTRRQKHRSVAHDGTHAKAARSATSDYLSSVRSHAIVAVVS